MIEFQNVTLRYHYEQYNLFENLSLTLAEGVTTILCDVQSGKSTLCKMILGLLPPNEGNVLIDGVALYNEKGARPQISALYLPCEPTFFENKTVLFNLQYPLRIRKQPPGDTKVHLLAEQYGLEEVLSEKVKNLNFRQKKLLSLARGQTVSRDIVLFDSFFDDTEQGTLSEEAVLASFPAKTKIILTSNPTLATGNTAVLDDKRCAYCGTSSGAREYVSNLMWLASREQQEQL